MDYLDTLTLFQPVAEAFEKAGVEYYIGGSVAASFYGIMRNTADIDVVADVREEHVKLLVDELSKDFYIDEQSLREAIRRRGSCNWIDWEHGLKVDVFALGKREWDQVAWQRRRKMIVDPFDGTEVFVPTAEDIILKKIEWYRMGNEVSENQWRDVLGVCKTQAGDLDFAYLHHWAKQINISDLLARALEESGMDEYKEQA
jgi:hypothetical protein